MNLFKLKELWTFKTNGRIEALAFSDDGYLGVPSWDYCAYILDQNGNLVNKYCGNNWMYDVSHCCGKFGFINYEAYAYIYDLSTGIWKTVCVGYDYYRTITMLKDGFLAGVIKLAYFDFNGYKRWNVIMHYIINGPAVYNGYIYVPRKDWPSCCKGALTILRLSNGSEVRTIEFSENVWDTQVCGHYLALGTAHHVYLYDISDPTNPRELWNYNGIATSCSGGGCAGAWNVAFSPDCMYLVSADYNDKKIHIFDVQTGRQVLERKFESYVRSVAWWEDRIAVGLGNGKVYVLKVEGYVPFGLSQEQWNSLTAQQKEALSKCYSALQNTTVCYQLAINSQTSSKLLSLNSNQLALFKICYSHWDNATTCLKLASNFTGGDLIFKAFSNCLNQTSNFDFCLPILKFKDFQLSSYLKCAAFLNATKCLPFALSLKFDIIKTINNALKCTQMRELAFKVLAQSNVTCKPNELVLASVSELSKRLCKEFNKYKLPKIPQTPQEKDYVNRAENYFLQCLKTAKVKAEELVDYCAKKAAERAAQELWRDQLKVAKAKALYDRNLAMRQYIVYKVLSPWLSYCGKKGTISVPDLNKLMRAYLVSEVKSVYSLPEPVTVTVTVPYTRTQTVTVIQQTVTVLPILEQNKQCYTVTSSRYVVTNKLLVPKGVPKQFKEVVESYLKLKALYDEVSRRKDFNALILKPYFQKNIQYIIDLARLEDLLGRVGALTEEVSKLINATKDALSQKPSFDNIYAAMGFLQKAKVDIALIESSLAQVDKLVGELRGSLPSTTNCNSTLAVQIIKGILNAKSALEAYEWKLRSRSMGGLDGAIRCIIKSAMLEVINRYPRAKELYLQQINAMKEDIAFFDAIVKDLSKSG